MDTQQFQIDLSEKEYAEMERLMAFAGIETQREFISNALALFQWVSTEMLYSRSVGSFDKTGQSVKQLEMPCLAAFTAAANQLNALRSPEEELQRRKAEDPKSTRSLSEILAEMHRPGANHAPSQNDRTHRESLTGAGKPVR